MWHEQSAAHASRDAGILDSGLGQELISTSTTAAAAAAFDYFVAKSSKL